MAVSLRSPATSADPAEDEGVRPFLWTRALYQRLDEIEAFGTETHGGAIAPLAAPNEPVRVDDLLP